MTIRRRIFALLASASLLAIPFTAASPALAHDEVIGTTPASGETVAAGAFEGVRTPYSARELARAALKEFGWS